MSVSVAVPAGVSQSRLDPENPWPALESFAQADVDYFHGRDAAVEALLMLLNREDVVLLYGSSGLGKTSLLRAGVFPRLPTELLPVYVRMHYGAAGPDETDAADLRQQILDAVHGVADTHAVEMPPPAKSGTLWEYFRRRDSPFWGPGNQLVTPLLVFDQFEQLFTRNVAGGASQAAVTEFLDDLGDLVNGRIPLWLGERVESGQPIDPYIFESSACKVVFSFREEFLADVKRLTGLVPSIDLNSFRLEPMLGKDAARAIRRAGAHVLDMSVPAGGDPIEDVAARMVRIVAGQPEGSPYESATVEPAILSVFCAELNEERKARAQRGGSRLIDADLVRERKASEIIAGFYRRAVGGVPRAVRQLIEDQLVLASGTRNSVALEQVSAADRAAVDTLITKWRLLRIELVGRQKQPRLELTHDVLVKPALEDRRARVESAGRNRERLQAGALAVAIVIAFAIALASFRYAETNRLRVAAELRLMARTVIDAVEVVRSGNTAEGLAELGSLIRSNPGDEFARSLTLDLLLRRVWLLPVSESGDANLGRATWSDFSADGELAVTTYNSGLARLWRPASGATVADLHHDSTVWSAVFSPKGDLLVTASEDNTARVWTAAGQLVGRIEHGDGVYWAEFSPSGDLVVTAAADGKAVVWQLSTRREKVTLDTGNKSVAIARFSQDGQLIVTASIDGRAQVWDAESGRSVAVITPGAAVIAAAFSVDGEQIALGETSGDVTVWVVKTGRLVVRFKHERPIRSVQFSADGSKLLAVEDIVTHVWDVATFGHQDRGVLDINLRHPDEVRSAFFNSNGRYVLTAAADGVARIWDLAQGGRLLTAVQHQAALWSARYDAGGQRVIVATDDGKGVVSRLEAPAPPLSLDARTAVVTAAFAPEGGQIIAGADDGNAYVWNATKGTERQQLAHGAYANGQVLAPGPVLIDFGGPGRLVTVKGWTAYFWTLVDGVWTERRRLELPGSIYAVRFEPGGKRAVLAAEDGLVRIWSLDSGDVVISKTEAAHAQKVVWVEFSADGKLVVSASPDKTARVWDASTGSAVGKPLVHDSELSMARFASSGRQLVTASTGGKAVIWTVGKETPDRSLDHIGSVVWLQWNRGDADLITAASDGTVRLWDPATGTLTARSRVHGTAIVAGALSADGTRIATGARDGTVRVLDARNALPQADVLNLGGTVNALRFDPPGGRLVVASSDGFARVFDLPRGGPADATWLATLVERLGGARDKGGRVEPMADWVSLLGEMRRQARLSEPATPTLEQRITRWLFTPFGEKTLSPFTTNR